MKEFDIGLLYLLENYFG